MASNVNWSERTDLTDPQQTTSTGLGASPSQVIAGDYYIAENSDLFREAILARNVYAAWARKLTNARPNDPKMQSFHQEVTLAEQLSTNWFNFKFALKKKPLPTVELTSNENIELAISELNQNSTEAFVEASKPKFNNDPKILSPEIKFKIYQRNRLRKFWQRTRSPSIYSEFRTLSREIAKETIAYSRDQWEKHIEALSPVDNTLWRKSSLLRKPFQSIHPLKEALGSIAITPIEKAEVIADSLQEQFEPNHVVGRELFDQRIHDEVTNFINTLHVQEIEPTTPTEVLSYVQRLKSRKSPGLDQISNRMLKNLPLKFLLFITLFINQLFKNNYFPNAHMENCRGHSYPKARKRFGFTL
ncbi:putative RNA-directed DNA polymerase from transposon X-element [Trichonephila clavipes]|nr:putative RNA-directed DNA polymerase from transposon X-element [Trichonephila clavipes]